MTAKRKSLNSKERARLFELHGGRCHICKAKIDGVREAWDIEHVIPFAMTRDDSDENRQPAHREKCHAAKTKQDVKAIAKAKRVQARHTGAKAPAKQPIPQRAKPPKPEKKTSRLPSLPPRPLYTKG